MHLVVYVTYDCNLRCDYCVICFNKDFSISFKVLNNIYDFVNKFNFLFHKVYIEFIWGEPLIEYNKILELVDKIKKNNRLRNVFFQITTNGTLIDDRIYRKLISRIDIVNLSYNQNYFLNNKLFKKISSFIIKKSNVNINFIYDPRKSLLENVRNFNYICSLWFTSLNILPIVLVYNYSEIDFVNLIKFANYLLNFKDRLNIEFIYYLQEKDYHFEFTIDPKWNILGDNMGTAEQYFNVKNRVNKVIGHISNMSLSDIMISLSDYSYLEYLKNITINWQAKQSFSNLKKLSILLKKLNDKISNRNRVN